MKIEIGKRYEVCEKHDRYRESGSQTFYAGSFYKFFIVEVIKEKGLLFKKYLCRYNNNTADWISKKCFIKEIIE